MWLIKLVFPLFCKSDMSKYGYLEVFKKVPWNSRQRESTVYWKFYHKKNENFQIKQFPIFLIFLRKTKIVGIC